MRSTMVVTVLVVSCASTNTATLEKRVETLERERTAPSARFWYCVYTGPSEPVLIASCFHTVDECSKGHISKRGSCIVAPFAWCVQYNQKGQSKNACFFENEYCEKMRDLVRGTENTTVQAGCERATP